MTPNNQWYFTSLANQIGTTINGYYNMKMLKNNAITPWRDGPMMQKVNNKIRFFGGWNPAGGANFTPSTNEQYETVDGVTFTQLTDAPWHDMHFALNCGSWLGYQAWIFGGDPLYGVDITAVWACDGAGTWQQMTADWGLSGLNIAAGCLHNNEFYIVGGEERSSGIDNTNVYKTVDGINFTTIASFPNTMSTGKLYSLNGYLYFIGGAIFTTTSAPGNIANYNDSVYKSIDGVTWTNIATLPVEFKSAWPSGDVFDNKIWMSIGYSPVGGNASGNHQLIYYSSDAITWTKLVDIFGNPTTQPHTHAAGSLTYNNALHFIGGNNTPLVSYKIEKVDVTYYNNIPKGCALILAMRNGEYFDGTPWTGTKCGQVATLNGLDTFEVGFIGGTGSNKFDIDITAVQTWAAGRDFYWSIRYDRSGNNNHAYNTVGNRPQAGIAGTMILTNGKPSSYSVSGDKTLLLTNQINLGNQYSLSAVLYWTANAREFFGGTAGYGFYNSVGGTIYHNLGGAGGYAQSGTDYVLNHQDLHEWYRDILDAQSYKNGTRLLDQTNTLTTNNFNITNLMGESSAYGFIGYCQDVIVKAGSPTLSDRYSIQTSIKNYYGI